jgi:hypothetical protein
VDPQSIDQKTGAIFQRFEAKYYLTEPVALAIRQYIAPYMVKDPHSISRPFYHVNSLYLDSPDLFTYRSSEYGEKNRFKLRIRSYSIEPSRPVYFEIKRRVDQVILKQRACVHRECVEDLLRGRGCTPDVLMQPRSKEIAALYHIRDMMERIQAEPKCMVCYEREAYMSAFEEPLRISFDRRLTCRPVREYSQDLWDYRNHWKEVDAFDVLMELKFTDTLPLWAQEVVQRFDLTRRSSAKYVICVNELNRMGCRLEGSGWERIPA